VPSASSSRTVALPCSQSFCSTCCSKGPSCGLEPDPKIENAFVIKSVPGARPLAAKEYHLDGAPCTPQVKKREGIPSKEAQSLHKSCRDPREGPANLEVAICNFKLVIPTLSGAEGERCATSRKMQIPHFVRDDKVWRIRVKSAISLPRAAIAMRPPAESLPRRSW